MLQFPRRQVLVRYAESRAEAGCQWQVSPAPGVPFFRAEATSNDQLRWVPVSGGEGNWEVTGERPGFLLRLKAPHRTLAAGWYELRGRLEVQSGNIELPSVRLQYVRRSALTDAEFVLPEPDASGCIRALMLFIEGVESLEFLPGICPMRFRMRGFSLRRVSRRSALRLMLGGPAGVLTTGGVGRLLTWGRALRSRGLKHATDELYADYRRRMFPRHAGEYAAWIRKYDTLSEAALDASRRRAKSLGDRGPMISVVLSSCDVPEPWLRRCLDSVLGQVWQRWELCVIEDGSPAPRAVTVLAEYAARDPRVRVTRRERGDDATGTSEFASAMARGEFIVPLDPGGELHPYALLRIAEAAAADPDIAILYSDEDRLDADGNRSHPDFKPDWNPDLLRSRNYVGHLVAIRTALVRDAGGFRAGFGGCAQHDLILRCSEHLPVQRIRHLPEILYHGRIAAGSAAAVKLDSTGAAIGARAIAGHLERIGGVADVETIDSSPGLCRVRWSLPQPAPKISLIIPTRDCIDVLRRCVESILAKSTYPDFELVVVDNRSSDHAALGYLRELATRERVRVLRYDAPFNFSAINNWAARQCDGPLLGLVNNDIEVISPGWLEEMAGFAVRPDVGAVGAMLYYPADTIQHAGMLLGINGVAGHVYAGKPRGYHGYQSRGLVAQNVSAVTGACLLVRHELFDAAGGLEEQLPVEFNDVDFCLRLRERGYLNVWTPFAELYHHESVSRVIEDAAAKRMREAGIGFMMDRWRDSLREDPAYNPNLSLQSLDFELAFPPRGRHSS